MQTQCHDASPCLHASPGRRARLQRVQGQILQWAQEGRWDCVVAEKRNVLVCMQQVLQSCHTLLESTQIPVDGVVRLLQHILRHVATWATCPSP